MDYRKIIFLILPILFLSIYSTKSQVSIASPNVGSITEQAVVPVSSFTGQANVSIPLYTVKYKELSVPISLNYNTQGNKVKEHPGFVGLGWSLSSGGLIYRKVNGRIDEHSKRIDGIEYNNEQSYYHNVAKVAENFNDLSYLKNYAFDGGNPLNYVYDGVPDEFIFNFNGYSGTFFIGKKTNSSDIELVFRPNGDYKLKGEIIEIKENVNFSPNSSGLGSYSNELTSSKCIYTIKITDDMGYVYIFGNSPENIEFGNPGNLMDNNYNTANAWHLSKITAPNGHSINFSYEKRGQIIIPDVFRQAAVSHKTSNFFSYGHLILAFSLTWGNATYKYSGFQTLSSYYFSYPSYLKSIKTPQQEILFKYSKSNDLQYDISHYSSPSLSELLNRSDSYHGSVDGEASHWQKLDEIEIKAISKTIKLQYKEKNTERLKLESVLFESRENDVVQKEKQYTFSYNTLQLPGYESRQVDHWGFFNGKTYEYNSDYYNTRQPNANFLQAEILNQIQYPNGGYVALEYEPHYYKKIAKQFPFEVIDNGEPGNSLAGGLRVAAIETKTDKNTTATKTKYNYNKDFVNGGTISSGILSGIPKYSNSGTRYTSFKSGGFWNGGSATASFYYQIGRDKNLFPLSTTNGNHITYTEVTEETGNGYITTTYSNHDNGYTDKSPSLMHSDFDSESLEDPFISNQAYRGLPLAIKTYSLQKKPVKEIQNEYTINTQSDLDVPFIQRITEGLVGGTRASSGKFPVSPALISKTIQNEFLGGVAVQSSTTDYKRFSSYTLNGQKVLLHKPSEIIKSNTSKNEIITTSFKYPHDVMLALRIQIWLGERDAHYEMVLKNMLAPVIEQTVTKNGNKQVSSVRTEYGIFNNNLIHPKYIVTKAGSQDTVSAQFFNKYDLKGNLLEQQQLNGPKTSYVWGYGSHYPIAEIKNASHQVVENILYEETDIDYMPFLLKPMDTGLKSIFDALRNSSLLKDAQINTYTYQPLIGMKTMTDSKGQITYYEYDKFQRLKLIKDQKGNIITSYEYNFKP